MKKNKWYRQLIKKILEEQKVSYICKKEFNTDKNTFKLYPKQAGTNYILPVHELSYTQRCLQCMIVQTKIVYPYRRHALEQKFQQKRPVASLHIKYR